MNAVVFSRTAPIHAEAPEFTDMSVEQEILVTGIKVVDLLAPYAKGGKIGTCPLASVLQFCFCFFFLVHSEMGGREGEGPTPWHGAAFWSVPPSLFPSTDVNWWSPPAVHGAFPDANSLGSFGCLYLGERRRPRNFHLYQDV